MEDFDPNIFLLYFLPASCVPSLIIALHNQIALWESDDFVYA